MFDRRLFFNFDWFLVIITLLLTTVGFASIFSVAHDSANSALYQRQLYYFFIGLIFMCFSFLFNYHYLERYAYHIYILSIILLIAVLFFGKVSYGAKRWLSFGIFSFQPSEFTKLSIILVLSKYFYGKGAVNDGFSIKELLYPLLLVSVPFLLVAAEPDLGTALIFLFIFASMVVFAKVKRRTIIGVSILSIGSIPVLWRMLKDYQKERVLAFLNPELDPLGAGYHIIQSKIAIGSGGLWGKGFLHGTQSRLNFLPAQHTDFIFSVFAEEWGFLGTVLLLLLYFLLILWGLNIVRCSRDRFGAYLGFGILSFIFWHSFFNIGMVLGMLPVVGVPLPFVSYGGSFLISSMIAIGILLNISMRRFMF